MDFLKSKDAAPTRRKFISTAAAATAGTAALGFPMVSRAQATTLRFQSTWPSKDIFHEYAGDFVKKVNDMSGGRLKIELLPAGAVVPAFGLLDAVNKGTLDGGHGVVAYWYGKNSAVALWGSGPAFGMDAEPGAVVALLRRRQGRCSRRSTRALTSNVVSYLYGPMPTQPFGWFKKPITKVEDVKGMKFRTVGLAVDMYTAHGCRGEPAARRRDRAGARPRPDRRCRVQQCERRTGCSASPMSPRSACCRASTRRANSSRVLFNKTKYDALPPDLKPSSTTRCRRPART